MPVYKLGPSESGGFRSILPPEPTPPSKVGKILSYFLAIALGLVGGVVICALFDEQDPRVHDENASEFMPSGTWLR